MTTEINKKALEQTAFNLCSLHGFAPEFVAQQEKFATAVIVEYLTAMQERGELGVKSLRDEFAMATLNGVYSGGYENGMTIDKDAMFAYQVADAMMEARK